MDLNTNPLNLGQILAIVLLILGCGGTERNSDSLDSGSAATSSGGTGETSTNNTASMGSADSAAAGPAGGTGGTGAIGANNATGGTAVTAGTEATGGTASAGAGASGMETTGGSGLEQVDCDLSPCAQDELCIPWDQGCDANMGRCVERESCSDASNGRVCGCDGNIYESRCDALLAGTRQADASACAIPEGAFVCDRFYCEVGVQFCQRPTITQCDGSTLTGATCITVPDECVADPTCDCLDQITDEIYDVVLGTCAYSGGWGLLSSRTCQGDGAFEEACVYSNAYCFG